jgi:hypothetical protein
VNVWKVILVTLIIFGAGVITGGVVARRTHSRPAEESWRHSTTNRMGQGFRPERVLRMDFVTRAKEELGLTPEQLEQIELIVKESQTRTREIWDQVSPQMRAEVKATQDKIRELLTPAQRETYEELMKQRHSQRNFERERREPAPDPSPAPQAPSNAVPVSG